MVAVRVACALTLVCGASALSTTPGALGRASPVMSLALPPSGKGKAQVPKMGLAQVLNPFDWSVERMTRPNKVEGADLYRMIGIAPDADYEEIKAKAASLAIKYANDPKRKIKIEVACDKIVELRLRQAAKGQLQMSGESLVRTQMDSARDAKAGSFQMPKWTRGMIVTPVPKDQAVRAFKYILGPGLVVAGLVPTFAPQMQGYIVAATLNMVYGRGRPKQHVEEGMPMPRMDFPSKEEFKKIIGLTAIFLGGAFGAAVLAAKTPFLPSASPRYFLTVLSFFGFVEVCLCKIYPKKGGK